MPVISVLTRLRQKDSYEFKALLSYIVRTRTARGYIAKTLSQISKTKQTLPNYGAAWNLHKIKLNSV